MDYDESSLSLGRRSSKIPPPVPKKKPRKDVVTVSELRCNTGSQESLLSDSFLDIPVDELILCDDLTRLPILYDDIVLECVCLRYCERLFYTWAGPTLVAANPCRLVDYLYTSSQIKHHHNQVKSGVDRRDAHVYSIAGVAHHRLTHDLGLVNQAVLVSGESGAGKTESARYMLGYLTHVETKILQVPRSPLKGVWEDMEPTDIQNKILASNPILEAFGNAATIRNHNSSRFGKLIRLQYGGQQLRGAEIDTYLLEKTRVTHQTENERNFHIFYQVLSGVRSGLLKDLFESEETYNILLGEATSSDLANLQETLHAFQQLNFSRSHQNEIFKVIAALLYLGNITFIQEEGQTNWTVNKASTECVRSLQGACVLLGLREDQLVNTLTVHTFSVSSAQKVSVFHKPCERRRQCVERRDALMQLIYQCLFIHIVNFINDKIRADRTVWSHFLGILDVYGFETFEQNSLEQLCINYANERLQQAFTFRYLSAEHQMLKEEGLLGMDVPYTDNSSCVRALDSRISVFAILNELKRDVKEDEACNRVCKALEHTGLVCAPSSPKHTPGFVICHYAGPVKYDAEGLLHKNKDEVPQEVWGLLAGSSQDFIGKLTVGTHGVDIEAGRRTTRKITTLSKFKSSVDTLMKTLSQCDLHYVRCIKPSEGALTGMVDREYTLHQLKACGVIETVCISQAGYPVRMCYADFYARYGGSRIERDVAASSIALARSILGTSAEGDIDTAKCRFGYTRVFLSESALHTLEKVREEKRNQAATCLQKCWRKYSCQKKYKRCKAASCLIQKNVKSWLTRLKYKKIKYSCLLIQRNVRRVITRKKYLRLYKATLTIQRYFRGWATRRKYEAAMQPMVMRPVSRQSVMSMNSLDYYSLTTSVSIHSLNPSLLDTSPCEGVIGDTGAFSLTGEALKAYLSPEHHQRLLETEESGIETDTESINGDASHVGYRRSRKLRRRSQLNELMEERSKAKMHHTASDESLADIMSKPVSSSPKLKNSNCKSHNVAKMTITSPKDSEKPTNAAKKAFSGTLSKNIKHLSDEKVKEAKPLLQTSVQRMRVATMRTFQEISGILKDYSPPESLQMVLSKQNTSLFFRDGVLSYRRMPVIAIKFHTRPTCLPFSHNLPHLEQPQGLWDAVH
ncbi:unconventional myosin-XIX isoform X2 [Cherax quadricarinatus]|uniref:unconventional myosin-XIX isoform X2 n=1 Tax=Cherax quadricarinatus TaxID=27406 RepID=UPI00387EBBEA